MASNGCPKVTLKAWRTLRSRATAAPSTKFTPSAVAAMLGMSSPESACDNTVTPMRRLGLIDEDGTLTARGHKWRVDASFADACQEILDEVYPIESYRVDHDVTDRRTALGPEPRHWEASLDWYVAHETVADSQVQLGVGRPERQLPALEIEGPSLHLSL